MIADVLTKALPAPKFGALVACNLVEAERSAKVTDRAGYLASAIKMNLSSSDFPYPEPGCPEGEERQVYDLW